MAAVAREPGAAAVPTITPPEPRPPDPASSEPGLALVLPDPPGPRQCALFTEKDESGAERRHVAAAANVSTEANVSTFSAELTQTNDSPRSELTELTELRPLLRDSAAGKPLSDPAPGAEPDPVQSAVSPLSLPAAPEAPEAGLSLGQPNGPDRGCTERTMSGSPDPVASERRFTALPEPLDRDPGGRDPRGGHGEDLVEDRTQDSSGPAETESGPELRPGTQVRVSLDHVIDDALVVSFRVGHKVFSGVLMDLSRRFGPYGIPVTAFPPRRESSRRHVQAPPPAAAAAPPPDPSVTPDPTLTPLFHQGAPYPPPLFLRDSYHQSLPQPLPRRIKRSRRRYGASEEPTCMLVRLRPRQVLCDRCKGAAGPRAPPVATRRRPHPDPAEENLSAEVKRLRSDEPRPSRLRREGPKREGPGGGATAPRRLSSGNSSSTRLRPSATSPGTSRVLTRRISSALAPPRIRLKPHRYRTDPEPGPQPSKTRTRPRPAPARAEPAQRTTKNSSKHLSKAPSRLQSRQERPGTRPGTKSGARSEQKDQYPRVKPETDYKPGLRLQSKAESSQENKPDHRTKTSQDQDLDQNPRLRPEPDPKPESNTEPDPLQGPEPRPDPPLQHSRRKQIFPKPTRDFDLDFPDWTGPETDLDQTEPEPHIDLVKPEVNPQRDSNMVQDQLSVCGSRTGLRFSETSPERTEQDPRLGPELGHPPEPGLEQKAELGPGVEPAVGSSTNESEAGLGQSRFSPGIESSCSPSKSRSGLRESGTNLPESIKPDSEPELRTLTVVQPESEPMDCSPEPSSDPSSDQVLPESGSKDSPTPDLTVRSRSSSKSSWSRSGSVVDSRPSSPASSFSSSGSSRSRPSSRSGSRSSEHSESMSRSRSSTKSGSESGCKPEPQSTSGLEKTKPELKLSGSPAPKPGSSSASKPGSSPTLKPDLSPVPKPAQSRFVPKCVGTDGRCVCVGDIVWAKIAGFPWWPARVLSLTVCRRGDGGVAGKQEARVAWFGSRTTSLLPLSHTSSFLETFQSRFDRKRKGPYRRAIAEAASAAKQLTPEVRALLTQFET